MREEWCKRALSGPWTSTELQKGSTDVHLISLDVIHMTDDG